MTRALQPDDAQRLALEHVLARIEAAGLAVADESAAQVRIEKDRGGRFPYVTFRAYGFREEQSAFEYAPPKT